MATIDIEVSHNKALLKYEAKLRALRGEAFILAQKIQLCDSELECQTFICELSENVSKRNNIKEQIKAIKLMYEMRDKKRLKKEEEAEEAEEAKEI